jgi:hypothetical protein
MALISDVENMTLEELIQLLMQLETEGLLADLERLVGPIEPVTISQALKDGSITEEEALKMNPDKTVWDRTPLVTHVGSLQSNIMGRGGLRALGGSWTAVRAEAVREYVRQDALARARATQQALQLASRLGRGGGGGGGRSGGGGGRPMPRPPTTPPRFPIAKPPQKKDDAWLKILSGLAGTGMSVGLPFLLRHWLEGKDEEEAEGGRPTRGDRPSQEGMERPNAFQQIAQDPLFEDARAYSADQIDIGQDYLDYPDGWNWDYDYESEAGLDYGGELWSDTDAWWDEDPGSWDWGDDDSWIDDFGSGDDWYGDDWWDWDDGGGWWDDYSSWEDDWDWDYGDDDWGWYY